MSAPRRSQKRRRPTVTWRVAVGNGGWAWVERIEKGLTQQALVRVEPDRENRLRIVELYLPGPGPLTAASLHRLPLGAIERHLNLPWESAAIRRRLGKPAIELRRLAQAFAGPPPRIVFPARAEGTEPGLPEVFEHGEAALSLEKPQGSRYTNRFYRDVAAAYRQALLNDRNPGAAIAEAAGVPRTTAARWIKHARKRGYLGAGRRGQAGEAGELRLRYSGPHPVSIDGTDLQPGDTITLPIDIALDLLTDETNWQPAPAG